MTTGSHNHSTEKGFSHTRKGFLHTPKRSFQPKHTEPVKSPGFWQNVVVRLKKNKLAMIALRIVFILSLIAIFADFIAYNKPFYTRYQDESYFPLFNDYLEVIGLYKWTPELIHTDWLDMERKGKLESSFWAPVRYLPRDIDQENPRALSPFAKQKIDNWKEWHFLGTDQDGRDVLSALIHGSRISLTIGLVAVGIAAFIGILLGAVAGFYGDNRLQLSRIGIIFLLIGLVLGIFYGFTVRSYTLRAALETGGLTAIGHYLLSVLILVGVTVLCVLISRPLERIKWFGVKKYLWLDIILSRIIEIWSSIPILVLIITIGAITEQRSIFLLMVLLGIFSWPGVARYMRGEILRTRNQMFIEAARSLGFREFRIIVRHAIPNSLAPVLVVIVFGIAGAISVEAALSFLGIGVPEDIITWGKLLSDARSNISAWWLSLFPGLAIFLTVTTLNLLGEGLRDALDPKVPHKE